MALRWMTSALLALTSLSTLTSAATPVNVFTSNSKSNNSGSSPTWQLGQQVQITWNTDYDKVKLGFMQASDNSEYYPFYNGTGNTATWTVNVNKTDWATDNVVYYMVVADFNNGKNGFYSKPVYIVAPGSNAPSSVTTATPAAPTSLARPATTIVITQTPTNVPTLTPSPTSSSTQQGASDSGNSSSSAQGSSSLGGGAIAGIAIGAVAGAAALAAAVFFLLRNRKLKRQLKNSEATTHAPYMPYDQFPPNAAGGAGKGPGFGGAAAAAGAGGAAGYYAEKSQNAQGQGQTLAASELPSGLHDNRASELPAGGFQHYPASPQPQQEPVEIGGTELTRPMDENTPPDSRPLMGEHPRDRTD